RPHHPRRQALLPRRDPPESSKRRKPISAVSSETVPTLKFSKESLQPATKPIPNKEPGKKDATTTEVQSQPRHATGFVQYCGTCARNQKFKVDTLGWKTCTVCHSTAPDRSQSPL